MVSSEVVLVLACVPDYPGCVTKEYFTMVTALLTCLTAVQQGFKVRGRNIGASSWLPFIDEARTGG